jgi:hypothetical protein
MKLITVKDLQDWRDTYEENPIIDGPIFLTKQEINEFMELLDKDIIAETDFYDLSMDDYTQEQDEYLLTSFVDFLNDKGFENDFEIKNDDFDDDYDDLFDEEMGNYDDDDMGIYDDDDDEDEK